MHWYSISLTLATNTTGLVALFKALPLPLFGLALKRIVLEAAVSNVARSDLDLRRDNLGSHFGLGLEGFVLVAALDIQRDNLLTVRRW